MAYSLQQMAKDVQSILLDAATCPVYHTEPPRDSAGAIAVTPPYVVYTDTPNGSGTENGQLLISLYVDVWALGSYESALEIAGELDEALNETVIVKPSGAYFADRDGAIMQRMEKDPADERIRRVTGQYVLRFAPQL